MGDRRLIWFFAGFSAALLVSSVVGSALAQGVDGFASRAGDSAAASRSSTIPQRPTDFGQAGTESVAPDLQQPADGDAPIDPDDPQDGDAVVPRIGARPVIIDGDPSFPAEPQVVQDGVLDQPEPLPLQDGADPTQFDTRRPEDIAVFENPPAGYDPLLFQIEAIDPVRDNRTTRRLFTQEPYDPIGIRIGSFVLFPEVEIGTAYTSNALLSPQSQSDVFGEFRPAARIVSNWNVHALELRGSADLSEHREFDSENDRGYNLEARGRLDVTRRTNVQGILARDVAQESRSSLNASAVGSRATQTTDRAEVALNHRFNRLSVQFRGSVSDFSYSDTQSLGVTTRNDDRDYRQFEETARATWEFKPTLSAFTEVAINQRNFDTANQSDLINRSSNGERYRVGVSFGNTGQTLRGEIGVGYGVQRPDDSRLASIDGLIVDANATWRFNELTSLLFTARSDINETTTANVGGALTRQAGVQLRHAFRRHLIGTAGLNYTTQDSQDGAIDDKEWRADLGVEYFMNREMVLFGEYTHTNFDAVGAVSDYTEDRVRMGVRLRR